MTDHTHTTIRLMTIAEGLESLRSYHDHIPVMLELQKEVMPIEERQKAKRDEFHVGC